MTKLPVAVTTITAIAVFVAGCGAITQNAASNGDPDGESGAAVTIALGGTCAGTRTRTDLDCVVRLGRGSRGACNLYAAQDGFVSSVSFGLTQTMATVIVVLLAGPAKWGRTVLVDIGVTLAVQRLAAYGQVSDAVTGALILGVVAFWLGLFRRMSVALRARVPGWSR